MIKFRWLLAAAILPLLFSRAAIAQSTLEEVSNQVEALETEESSGTSSEKLLEQLREHANQPPNSAAKTTQQNVPTQNYTQSRPPNVWGNAQGGVNEILDTDRIIDPITGRIDSSVGRLKGSVNNGINRALNGILSPVDNAIDNALGSVNGAIDRGIASIMSPVDDAINNALDGIDAKITEFLDGIFGKAVEDTLGGVLDEATGGLLGGIFSGGGKIKVEKAYNPLSQVPDIVTSATFSSMLSGVTNPYLDTIPFEPGGMGLPDYSTITPVIDALVAGRNGNPNQVMQGADRFSVNPQGLSMSLAHEVERIGSRAIANATLSKVGQDRMKADLEGAVETLDAVIEIADDAQDKDVTQDVMKNLSAQLAQDSVLRAGQYRQSMLDRQQGAANAVVTTEIAKLLDEQNRARRSDLMGNAAAQHRATSGFHLPGESSKDDVGNSATTFARGKFRQ